MKIIIFHLGIEQLTNKQASELFPICEISLWFLFF